MARRGQLPFKPDHRLNVWWAGLTKEEKGLVYATHAQKLSTIEVNDKFLDTIFISCPICKTPVAYKSHRAVKNKL